MAKFVVGSTVWRREVLHGQVWAAMPMQVVADDDVLAVWLENGTELTFPPHPYGPHPWSHQDRWTGSSVLQLHRPNDSYAVWAFFRDGNAIAGTSTSSSPTGGAKRASTPSITDWISSSKTALGGGRTGRMSRSRSSTGD